MRQGLVGLIVVDEAFELDVLEIVFDFVLKVLNGFDDDGAMLLLILRVNEERLAFKIVDEVENLNGF